LLIGAGLPIRPLSLTVLRAIALTIKPRAIATTIKTESPSFSASALRRCKKRETCCVLRNWRFG